MRPLANLSRLPRQLARSLLNFAVMRFAPDFTDSERNTIRRALPFTMTGPMRLHALIQATGYVARNDIPGAFVEAGVWKGGSMMAVADTLMGLEQSDRELYLFDTFEGMAPPGAEDVTTRGVEASTLFEKMRGSGPNSDWCYASLEEVREAIGSTGYPPDRIHFVKGKVEDTIPDRAPAQIALLRLDTDWYESTRHELTQLYPRISRGGVLIIDDYGHWLGARKAVDEYVKENDLRLYLHRIDYTARIAIKP